MIHDFPPLLKKSAIVLMLGIIILLFSLIAKTAVTYLITIGLGSGCLALGLLGYIIWFIKQLKEPA